MRFTLGDRRSAVTYRSSGVTPDERIPPDYAHPMKNRSRAFTLFELMVVLALAAVIRGLGAPQFRKFPRNNRMAPVANDFLGGTQTAPTEAIKRQLAKGSIAICPSANPDDDEPACLADSTRAFNGWI